MKLLRKNPLTLEPPTAVVALFAERQIFCLVINAKLGLDLVSGVFGVIRHGRDACTLKSVLYTQLARSPVTIAAHFSDDAELVFKVFR